MRFVIPNALFVIPATAGIHSSTRESARDWKSNLGKLTTKIADTFPSREMDSRCSGNDNGVWDAAFMIAGGTTQ